MRQTSNQVKAVALLIVVLLLLLACNSGAPAAPAPTWTPVPTAAPLPTYTPYPTWTPAPTATLQPTYTPLPTYTPYPTWTPAPTATSRPTPRPTNTPIPTIVLPTATPLPPVSINSDCIGCPVVMPGHVSNQVTKAYQEWSGAEYHPDKVLLVTCSREAEVLGVGHIYGSRGSTSGDDIAVKGIGVVKSQGSCFAITAKYDGLETVCYENFVGQCQFGTGGRNEEILSFKRAGQQTDLSATQYSNLLRDARSTEYEASVPSN